MDWVERLSWAVVVAIVVGGIVFGAQFLRVESHCMSRGWTSARVAWNLKGYCVSRVDQSDVVVPWRQAKPR
jgi:hypothetical protein